LRTRLVSIETDSQPLDGLYYEPENGPLKGAVQLFHGNTMNFYVGPLKFLPPALTALGYACLAYNRRGHDILSTRDSREAEGGAFQTFDEAFADNRIAREWLQGKGFDAPVVIGHSNGGVLATRHTVDHVDTPALVLLSAHRGGRNVFKLMSANGLMAQDRYAEFEAVARALLAEGKGDTLLHLPGWWYTLTARSYVEYLDRCPDILALAPQVSCPVLYVVGDEEPADLYPARAFEAVAAGSVRVETIANCGHFYVGREAAVCDAVTDWLSAVAG
jgi:pimeloyl-ACP methyl ester carboxylesterase